ncbi:Adenine specific DNA methyltransferase, partial [mine drainage metagenome]
ILDPATGTGTFLYAVIASIRAQFEGNAGAWPGYVAEHLLPRLFGFELLMAPYAVAHMKLGLELELSGYDFASDQRLGVFLTNSLEEAHELTGLPLVHAMAGRGIARRRQRQARGAGHGGARQPALLGALGQHRRMDRRPAARPRRHHRAEHG